MTPEYTIIGDICVLTTVLVYIGTSMYTYKHYIVFVIEFMNINSPNESCGSRLNHTRRW